jgi:hypothetical protein
MSSSKKGAPKRLRPWVNALRPAIGPLRELMMAGGDQLSLKPLERAFRELNLDPNNQIDWKILAVLLAVHLFDEGKKRGRPPWTTTQLIELLATVHTRRQNNADLTDEDVCLIIARDRKSPAYFRVSPRTVEPKGLGLVKKLGKARQQFRENSLARAAFPLAFSDTRRN